MEIAAARDAMAEAEAAVQAAQMVLDDAEGELAVRQRAVAGYAAAIYRDGGAVTPLTLLLSGATRGRWSPPWGSWTPSTPTQPK